MSRRLLYYGLLPMRWASERLACVGCVVGCALTLVFPALVGGTGLLALTLWT
jgi:hypothetical protein